MKAFAARLAFGRGSPDRCAAWKSAINEAIIDGLRDAYVATGPDAEYHALADRLMGDTQESLGDTDEMRGDLDRPVGETVAWLCAAVGGVLSASPTPVTIPHEPHPDRFAICPSP